MSLTGISAFIASMTFFVVKIITWVKNHTTEVQRNIVLDAVSQTWVDLARGYKASSEGSPIGQMTEEQKKECLQYCLNIVEENTKGMAWKLIKTLFPIATKAAVEQAVTQMKNIPEPPQLPQSVTDLFPDAPTKG